MLILSLSRFTRAIRKKTRISLLMIVGLSNFVMGLFIITSIVSITEKHSNRLGPIDHELNPVTRVVSSAETTTTTTTTVVAKRRILSAKRPQSLTSSDYYFRLSYTIVQGICKPLHLFNTSRALPSLENMTSLQFNSMISTSITIAIDILRINPTLTGTKQIEKKSDFGESLALCDYVLQLDIAVYFSLNCDDRCHSLEIERLLSATKLIAERIDPSWSFQITASSPYEPTIRYQIKEFFLHRISKYQDTPVLIHSLFEDRYVSSLVIDSEGSQTSVIMSQREKSLFLVQTALDQSKSTNDPLSIYVSFLCLSVSNSYLRHYNGRITLSKFEPTDIFKQDATFKLTTNYENTNSFTLESTNLPQWFISVDSETKTALTLTELQPAQREHFSESFLFQFMHQYRKY